MKKYALVLALAAIFGVVAVQAATAKPKDTVTLRMLVPTQVRAGWDIMIANFERAYPNIVVQPQYIDGAVFTPTILTMFAAGNEPDLFTPNSGSIGASGIYALATQGKLLDLTPKNLWWKRVPKEVHRYYAVRGRIYEY